jgi:hypothetical protein
MNLSTAIFLVNKTVRSVKVSYEPDAKGNPGVLFKTLDLSLKVGDKVVVPTTTRWGMTVCKVEEIDFRVNFDSPQEYLWVIGRVDEPAYDSIKEQEEQVLERVAKAEENRKRAELAKALQLDSIDLQDIDIVSNASVRLPAPASPRGEAPATPEAPAAG